MNKRIYKAVVLLSLGCLTTGCTIGLWDSYPVNKPVYYANTRMTDNVVSSFRYQNLKLLSQKKDLGIPDNGIGFMGENYVYILTTGADDLLALNQYAGEFHFVSKDSNTAIPLNLVSSPTPQAIGIFNDIYAVKVDKPSSELSHAQVQTLTTLGFKKHGDEYSKTIAIDGIFFKKSQLKTAVGLPEPLSRKYRVDFYTNDKKTVFSAYNLTTDIVFTPVTAAADIIVVPLGYALLALISDE